MSCEETRRLIDEDPASAGFHVDVCASCREYRDRTAALDDALRALPMPRLGSEYWKSYSQRLRGRLPRARRPWLWIPLAAAAGLLLLSWPKPEEKRSPLPRAPKKPEAVPTPLTRFTMAFDRAVAGTPDGDLNALARSHWRHLILKAASEDRRTALTALSLLERIPESAAELANLLGRDAWRDGPILQTLARMDSPASRSALRKSLEDRALQGAAMAACAALPSRTSVPMVLSSYPVLLDEVRPQADAIFKTDVPLVRALLLRVYPTVDDETAATFAPLVAGLRLREAIPRLVRLAHAPSHLRVAVEALTAIGTPELLRSLVDLPATELVTFARNHGRKAVAILRELASSRNRGAVELLAELGESRALLEAYPRSGIRNEIVAALGRLKSHEVLEPLLRIAADGRVSAQTLCEALAGYPTKDVVPRLIRNLEDPFSRPRAHEILKRLTGERLAPSANAWEQWWKRQKAG